MPITNSQYEFIISKYRDRLSRETEARNERVRAIYTAIPELTQLDAELSRIRTQYRAQIIEGDSNALQIVNSAIDETTNKKMKLLAAHGYSPRDLEIQYTCKDCKDTGYLDNGNKCHCLKQEIIKLIYSDSHLSEDLLNEECFDNFSLEYYSDEIDPSTELTYLELAQNALRGSHNFVENFDKEFGNILFYGLPGVGKTFLSNCIAGQLIKNGHSVIYLSAYDFFEAYRSKTFNKDADSVTHLDDIEQCDLLIIDDLGTEFTNSFTITALFQCINTRLLLKKSTIISTNLDPVALRDTYQERIMSRINSTYRYFKLSGEDIRQKRRNK